MSSGKLVRDRIPELIAAEGRKPIIKTLEGDALVAALYHKLAEEHDELRAASGIDAKCEELADILEVLVAIAAQYGCDEAHLHEIAARKREARGGFEKGFFYQGD
ncbi:nucleoside triphosphate pyrophosphohydrolase [Ruegeria pomeroyi]|nr:nucleoside triphosphate pyrophosphohydrolase [Ruegeria pomeroyi]